MSAKVLLIMRSMLLMIMVEYLDVAQGKVSVKVKILSISVNVSLRGKLDERFRSGYLGGCRSGYIGRWK